MENVAFNPCVMECHTRKFLQGGTKHCFSEVMVMLWLAVLIHATFLFWLIDIHPGVCWLETPSFSPKWWVVASACNFYGQCQIPVLGEFGERPLLQVSAGQNHTVPPFDGKNALHPGTAGGSKHVKTLGSVNPGERLINVVFLSHGGISNHPVVMTK